MIATRTETGWTGDADLITAIGDTGDELEPGTIVVMASDGLMAFPAGTDPELIAYAHDLASSGATIPSTRGEVN